MLNSYILKNNLVVRVYTIGFDPMGESILFTINDGNNVIFSGLIDCFIDGNDYITKLLKKLKIKKFNYFCITHPDYDHCAGISNIINMLDNNTKVVIPSRIFDFMDDYDERVKTSLESLRELFMLRADSREKPIFNTVCNNSCIIDNLNFVDSKGKNNILKIETITPSTNVIERYAYRKTMGEIGVYHNDFSVINLIQINDVKILLTGDAVDDNIKDAFKNMDMFANEFFESKIDFIKIPHHTSQGSRLLFDKLKQAGKGIGVSATTIYRSSNLPNPKLLSEYNSYSDFSFCTSKKFSEQQKNGIILYEVDVTDSIKNVFLVDSAVKATNYI